MEHSPDNIPAQGKEKGSSNLLWGLALLAVLTVGVAFGYFIRQTQDTPVQVVVTATPETSRQAAPQTAAQTPTKPATTPSSPADNANTPPTPTIMDFVLSDARHFQGSDEAPITMIEFSDFKWPYCGRFAADSLSRIREQYVNTGKVRFVYKHFAILGPESNRVAEASECAAEQGQFWAYHDRVFADQNESRSSLSAERLGELAREVGLDTTTFNECLNSGRYASLVSRETLGVQSLGVRGTPAFLINGVFVSGAQPFEVFQQVIEEQLGQAQSGVESTLPTAEPADTTSSAPPSPTNDEVVVEDEIEGVVIFPDPGLAHQDGEIAYPQALPAGGDHSDEWQNCGIYDQPVPTEPAVHSLEHGAVWIAYRPDLPPDQVEILRALVRQERQARGESLVLLAPVAEASLMDTPIVATAWRAQLQLDDASDERLRQFLSQYQNGPFTPEPEAPCSGSVGEPLE